MLRKFTVSVVVASCVALLSTISPAGADDAILRATLTGAAERPGPGDPDAFGLAWILIDDDSNQLCMFLFWLNVDGTLSGLHIHEAPPTDPGPIRVPFATPPTTGSSGSTFQCVTVANEALLDNIAANPGAYYVNLHSTPLYPGGAIRGQLQTA